MSLSTTDFVFVRDLIRSRAGLVLEEDKSYLAESRLSQLAKDIGLATIEEVVSRLRNGRDAALSTRVVEAMTTNETSFFRDLHPFETLRKVIIPELMKKRAAERRLHIWCGAASTGQEPYSVAMMLMDHFPTLMGWDLKFVATDISMDVLSRARAGKFNQLEVNRGLPASMLVKYFERHGTEWQIKESVRRMVKYSQLNLIDGRPDLAELDLVLLRNVLIYFDVPTKRLILGKIRRWMRPDGYLFLGSSETTWNIDESFERLTHDRSAYYQIKKS